MPPPEMVIRACAKAHGWEIREMPAIPAEAGWIEVWTGSVTIRATIPREADPAYCPWDALYQACAALVLVD